MNADHQTRMSPIFWIPKVLAYYAAVYLSLLHFIYVRQVWTSLLFGKKKGFVKCAYVNLERRARKLKKTCEDKFGGKNFHKNIK